MWHMWSMNCELLKNHREYSFLGIASVWQNAQLVDLYTEEF